MNTIHLIAALALPAGLAVGQCAFSSASVSQFGPGCNPVVGATTAPLAVNVSIPSCAVGLNTVILLEPDLDPVGRVLVLGLQAGAVPVPAFGAGCVLYPSPDVVLFDPWYAPAHQLQIPPVPLPPTTVYAQGVVLYRLLSTGALDWGISGGVRIDLQ